MSRLIKYFLTLSLAAVHSSYAQDTVYRCDPFGGGSTIYQTIPFKEGDCEVEEKKTFDTDTNVMGAGDTSNQIGVQGDSQSTSGSASATPSGTPDKQQDEAVLISGEESELRVGDPGNTSANESASAGSGIPANSSTTSTSASPGGSAGFGGAGGLGSGAAVGP